VARQRRVEQDLRLAELVACAHRLIAGPICHMGNSIQLSMPCWQKNLAKPRWGCFEWFCKVEGLDIRFYKLWGLSGPSAICWGLGCYVDLLFPKIFLVSTSGIGLKTKYGVLPLITQPNKSSSGKTSKDTRHL
jgi:hypothetical protein